MTTDNAPAPQAAKTGDLTYYAPWGNLAVFYKDGPSASEDLLILGHIDADADQLSQADRITIEAASVRKPGRTMRHQQDGAPSPRPHGRSGHGPRGTSQPRTGLGTHVPARALPASPAPIQHGRGERG
ncbi:cyclophilin-like fold protein [Streptomyces massasporeus]|uniref:Cyclophilin-like fold protein n=1 Tax=Streptomyces massasporeus TaxID=67324 RepID=A0ABW6LF69_9ACTN